MSENSRIEVDAADLAVVGMQLQANPADGAVALEVLEGGQLTAEWVSKGRTTKVGPAQVRQIRDILGS